MRSDKWLMIGSLVALTCAWLSSPCSSLAQDDPRQFIDRVFSRASWKDMQAEVNLTMTNKRGNKKVRKISMWSRRNEADESSLLMRFMEPADVRGTGFLLIEHNEGEDDRRLYLPALRRVNRISASGSGGNFMSSDFTYYDVGRPDLEDWSYAFGAEKTINTVTCRAVVGTASSDKVVKDTGYSKVTWYVDPERMVVMAADYHDKAGKLFKVMEVLKIEQVSGSPFATRMRMTDQTSGHSSEMVFSHLATDQNLSKDLFTERSLRKWTQ